MATKAKAVTPPTRINGRDEDQRPGPQRPVILTLDSDQSRRAIFKLNSRPHPFKIKARLLFDDLSLGLCAAVFHQAQFGQNNSRDKQKKNKPGMSAACRSKHERRLQRSALVLRNFGACFLLKKKNVPPPDAKMRWRIRYLHTRSAAERLLKINPSVS